MRPLRSFALLCLLILGVVVSAAPAWAQDGPSLTRDVALVAQGSGGQTTAARAQQPRTPRPPVGLHAYGLVEIERMAASQSFGAVAGSSMLFGFGGGLDVIRLHKGLFARVSYVRASRTGEGVAIDDDEVFPLGVPLTATLQTFDFGAGWRFVPASAQRRATPYVGGGLAMTGLRETDEFSESEEQPTTWKTGFMFFGGVDWPLGRRGMFGVEGQFRTVPNALGVGGVSADFEETNLGGLAVRVMIGFRR
jgi:hypothetical protein